MPHEGVRILCRVSFPASIPFRTKSDSISRTLAFRESGVSFLRMVDIFRKIILVRNREGGAPPSGGLAVKTEKAVVTTKGQLVIPARIRRRYRILPGTQVCFVEQGPDLVLKPVTDEYIRGLAGMLGTKGRVTRELLAEKKRERGL